MRTHYELNSFSRYHPYSDYEIDRREERYAQRTLAIDEIERHARCKNARINAVNNGKKVYYYV